MWLLKVLCIMVIGMLLLPVNVLAVVYDDEGKVITEEDIKAEMGSAMSRVGCGCFGETMGFIALAVIGGEGDPSTRDIISGVLKTSGVCTAISYLCLEVIEKQLGYASYPKYRAIGSILGGLSLFVTSIGIVSITRDVENDYVFLISLASLPVGVGLGTLIGYEVGKPFDRKIAINRIKEKRRNQRQGFLDLEHDSLVTVQHRAQSVFGQHSDKHNGSSIRIPLLAEGF